MSGSFACALEVLLIDLGVGVDVTQLGCGDGEDGLVTIGAGCTSNLGDQLGYGVTAAGNVCGPARVYVGLLLNISAFTHVLIVADAGTNCNDSTPTVG